MTLNGSWSIQEVTRATGVTSRTLRHYDAIGLLPAAYTGSGGTRHYRDGDLVRLQRILLLRDLGLGLSAIAEVLAGDDDSAGSGAAHDGAGSPRASELRHLRHHLDLLELERTTLERRIAALHRTIAAREEGTAMTDQMFDGFDHTQYEEEVSRRWGREAYRAGDTWWRGRTAQEKQDFKALVADLSAAWVAAARAGEAPDGEVAQALAQRHVAWLTAMPGTPASQGVVTERDAYVLGLGEMYVADDRFRANYTGASLEDVPHGPELVRDALRAWVAAAHP